LDKLCTTIHDNVLTVASLIPLGISMGLAEEYFPKWKIYFKCFATLGFLVIAITSIGGMDTLKKIAIPLFHGAAGLAIFIGPFYAKGAPKGFFWVGIGGLLIGLGGIALACISVGKQLLFFSPEFVMLILTPLLFLIAGAFALGFAKKVNNKTSEVLKTSEVWLLSLFVFCQRHTA
jgi:hypothetical protein